MVVFNTVRQFLLEAGVKHNNVLMVAVSGGLDSMLLWDTIRNLGYTTIGIHVNYKLRGEESDKDELLVREYADKHNLELEVFEADPSDFNENLQERARIFRYEKFNEIREKRNVNFVLTAHHANDDAETFFVNLIRGAGIAGLKGIAEKRDYFLRPFLSLSKTQLLAYADEVGLKWREDQSNASDKYLRNKIRHQVIPEFLKIDERAESGLKNSLSILKNQNELYQYFIEKYRSENLAEEEGLLVLKLTNELLKMPQLLYEVLLPFGNFNTSNILDAISQSGKKFISEAHTIWIDRNRLLIEENQQNYLKEKLIIEEGTKQLEEIAFKFLSSLPEQFKPTPQQAWLNADLLTFPLTLRAWEQGDKFMPFGMKGQKKISDYLNDIKMPLPLKRKVLVLENCGEIIWLVGHRIDERFKVGKNTKLVYFAELLKKIK